MSEKRFIFYEYDDGTETIEDTEENEYYHFSNELVGLLNEQQATISALKEENEQLRQQLVDVTKSIDSLCNRVDKSNRSNEFKWGAIMGLRTLQRELKGDGV